MTCIIASSPPSGPSRLPETGAFCTSVYDFFFKYKVLCASKACLRAHDDNYLKIHCIHRKRHLIDVTVRRCAWLPVEVARDLQSSTKNRINLRAYDSHRTRFLVLLWKSRRNSNHFFNFADSFDDRSLMITRTIITDNYFSGWVLVIGRTTLSTKLPNPMRKFDVSFSMVFANCRPSFDNCSRYGSMDADRSMR